MTNSFLQHASRTAAYRALTRQPSRRQPRVFAGIGCNCKVAGLSGYRVSANAIRFGRYELRNAVRTTLRGLAAGPEQPVLLPLSDKKAIAAAIRAFQGQPVTLQGFGAAEQAQGALSLGATGAKVGSVIPGIGTVIGFIVGAAIGFFLGKSKPPRASAAQKADCTKYVAEYMEAAQQNPNSPIPLNESDLKGVNWCLQALYGEGDIRNRDPRYFDGNFIDLMKIAKEVVTRIYDTPVGGIVNISETVNKIGKQTFRSAGLSFTNPAFTDLKTFSRDVFTRVAIDYCNQTAGKGASGCEKFFTRPEYQRLFYDMLGYAARTLLPNISEADLRAASVVAQQTGTSARDVVAAVETVIKRNVQRDETAALLAPSSGTPLPINPIPLGPLPTPGATPPTSSPSPVITPTLQPYPNMQLPSFPSSGISPLAPYFPTVENDLISPVATTPGATAMSATWYTNPYILGGAGLLAIFAAVMYKRGKRR